MIDEKINHKGMIFTKFLENEKWQPIDNKELEEHTYSDCEYIDNFINKPVEATLEIEPIKINKELMNKLEKDKEYYFIMDNNIKLKGTIKQDYLHKKWVYKKKGKRYKKFLKHSKQAIIIFNGVVEND